jgi:hypothetical protein
MDTLRFSTASRTGNTFAYGGLEAAWGWWQVHGMVELKDGRPGDFLDTAACLDTVACRGVLSSRYLTAHDV